jgi:transglutaminase-like putative cysteine protease
MIFKIYHKIVFSYSTPIFLEPMAIRLQPRSDCTQELLQFHLTIHPQPAGKSEGIDLEGNDTHFVWFNGLQDSLTLTAKSKVRTFRENPFDFIITEPKGMKLPMKYPSELQQVLKPYLIREHKDQKIKKFAHEILEASQHETFLFLINLTKAIHQRTEKKKREKGHPKKPGKVLEHGEGACRDLTALFMDACRSIGLAARYVSGYTRGDDRLVERELHAWAEVYLPGGGWRGFDPTIGLTVANNHVALAASPDPFLTLPTSGKFRGTQAKSQINYQVRIQTLP